MERYRILPGTDWRGDTCFNVYDTEKRIMLGRYFYAVVHAQDYVESLERRHNTQPEG